MKPVERIVICWLFFVGWIGLWLTGPETPGDSYGTAAHISFIAGIAFGVFLLVRAYVIFYREQNADRLREVLRGRDARPGK